MKLWNNRKHIQMPVPGTGLLSLDHFLGDKSTTCIFHPNIWTLLDTDPKSLGISWVMGVLFVLIRQLLVSSWITLVWGLVSRKMKPWLEVWNFQLHPPSSGKGRGTGNWVNDWSCLHDRASIKFPKVWSLESFQVGEHVVMPCKVACHESAWKFNAPSHIPCPVFSSCSSVSFIIHFIMWHTSKHR